MIKHWVALSGGVDSHVLLHFLATHFSRLSLQAIHVNHQLLEEAKSWEKHCQILCKSLNVPLNIVRISITHKKGESLEALARQKRYEAFESYVNKNDILLTAHHMDDQAETVLLQLFRGAGLRGVCAMPSITPFGKGFLLRPLLRFSRNDLVNYAKQHQLNWVNDPSNEDQRFDRNYLRHTIMPALKKRWPQIDRTLSRFATHCASQEKLIDSLSSMDYQTCHGIHLNTLYIPALLKLSHERQQNVLRYFLFQNKLPSPPKTLLEELQHSLFKAKPDAKPLIQWNNIYFRRYQKHLLIDFCKLSQHSDKNKPKQSIFNLLNHEEREWCKNNLSIDLINPSVSIKFRQGGERFKPFGKNNTRLLKTLFQEWKIPPWLRGSIPLLYKGNKIIAVIGYDKGASDESLDD